MKKLTGRNFVRLAGITLVIYATWVLGFKIPDIDKELQEIQTDIDDIHNYWNSHSQRLLRWQADDNKLILSQQFYNIRLRLPRGFIDTTEIRTTERDLDKQFINVLQLMYPMGKKPPVDCWEKMDFAEKQEERYEVIQMFFDEINPSITSIKIHKEDLSSLTEEKHSQLRNAIMIQVVGLVLINIAEFFKRINEKKPAQK